MNKIITIGREYGSGGHEIGNILAEKFNVPIFDRELIVRAAKDSGICEDMILKHEEKPTNSFLFNLVMDTHSFGHTGNAFTDQPLEQKVYLAQFDAIKKAADEGPCIIVGRCADYALNERDDVINIFIYADSETRIKRIMKRNDLPYAKAKELIEKKNKQRQSYYNYYTDKKWGRAESYNLCVDSGILGIQGTADFIETFIINSEKNEK